MFHEIYHPGRYVLLLKALKFALMSFFFNQNCCILPPCSLRLGA